MNQQTTASPPAVQAVSPDETELSDLAGKAQRGDQEACQQWLEKMRQRITPYIEHSLRRAGISPEGRAEDIVQDTLLALYSKRATYDCRQLFLPWMYSIAKYKLIDNLRNTKGKRFVPIDQSETAFELSTLPPSSASIDVQELLKSLPKKQREVLRLVKLEGLSIAEASKKTGYSPSDVKVSIHRGLRALKKGLRKNINEDE